MQARKKFEDARAELMNVERRVEAMEREVSPRCQPFALVALLDLWWHRRLHSLVLPEKTGLKADLLLQA